MNNPTTSSIPDRASGTPSQEVTIYGPNLPRPFSDTGTLHVHAAGCADAKRYRNLRIEPAWSMTASSIAEVIEDIYPTDNFDYDPADHAAYSIYRSDVHVYPCVILPEQAES